MRNTHRDSWIRAFAPWFAAILCVSCSTSEPVQLPTAPAREPSKPRERAGRDAPTPRDAGQIDASSNNDVSTRQEPMRDAAVALSMRCREARDHERTGCAGLPSDSTQPDDGTAITINGAVPRLSRGPMLGNVSANAASFWVRASDTADWAVRIWPHGEPNQARRIVGPTLRAQSQYVGVVDVPGLRPNTVYTYAIEVAQPGAPLLPASPELEFHTFAPAGAHGRLRVVLGADIDGGTKQPIFDQMLSHQPDLALFLGDQVYADGEAVDFEGYAKAYFDNWGIPALAGFLRLVPTFMIWDDHEIQDDYYRGATDRYAPARRAYELYVHARNPARPRPGKLHYRVDAGDVSFFVLDVRSERSRPQDPDGPDKSMLGEDQKHDLFDWLLCSDAKLKVIASPVTFSNWGTTDKDGWAGYPREREEIFSFIAQHGIDDVLLLTGDQHWSAVFVHDRPGYRFMEFMPTPLSKARRVAPTEPADDILARDDDHFVFGVVDIDTTQTPFIVDLTLCAADKPCRPGQEPAPGTGLDIDGLDDNVPFTMRLSSNDFGVR